MRFRLERRRRRKNQSTVIAIMYGDLLYSSSNQEDNVSLDQSHYE